MASCPSVWPCARAAVVQVNGCFDAGMAYVSLSRVRSLGGLRFQRHCPHSLECDGCSACCCQLTPASVRAHGDVKTYYALAHDLEQAVRAAASRIEAEAPFLQAEVGDMRLSGPAAVSALAGRLAERIDVPQPLRILAGQLRAKAEALNPGQRGEPSTGRGRLGTGVEGWWTLPPVSDSKAQRTV